MGFRGRFIRSSIAPLLAPSLVCARSGLRLARVFAVTAAALLFVALPQAASASLSWSGPITIDEGDTGIEGYGLNVNYYLLSGVACPSTSQCTAVDARGQELTFDPASPGTPTPTTISNGYPAGYNMVGGNYYPAGNYGLEAVACPSTSQCTAVEWDYLEPPYVGRQVTFDPETGLVITAPTTIDDNGGTMKAVACPSTSQCTAVDYVGNEVTFDPNSPGTPTTTTIGTAILQGVACPSTSQCTAVYATRNGGGNEVTFDPNSPGTPTPTTIDAVTFLDAVACPSTSQCTAVDEDGNQVTFDPTSPGTVTPTTIDAVTGLDAVACPSTSQCTAVDHAGYQVTFDPTSPGTPTRTVLDDDGFFEGGTNYLSGVACPSVALCVVVGYGDVFVGQESVVAPPANSSPPVISGTVKVGQTLSTSTGTWSGTAPISYSYRWARCSSSCSAISGAAASSYTPTSGDVGQKISVVVTATNTAGSAQAGAADVGPGGRLAVGAELGGSQGGAIEGPQAFRQDRDDQGDHQERRLLVLVQRAERRQARDRLVLPTIRREARQEGEAEAGARRRWSTNVLSCRDGDDQDQAHRRRQEPAQARHAAQPDREGHLHAARHDGDHRDEDLRAETVGPRCFRQE